MVESKFQSYLSPSSSTSSSPSRSRRSRTLHERLIEVMQEKKQRLGALASPSGRVHSLTEDFLEAFVSDLYFVSVFLITSSKSDWLSSFNHRRLVLLVCVYNTLYMYHHLNLASSRGEFTRAQTRPLWLNFRGRSTIHQPTHRQSAFSSLSEASPPFCKTHIVITTKRFIHWIVQRDQMHLKIVLGRILLAEKTFKCIPRK